MTTEFPDSPKSPKGRLASLIRRLRQDQDTRAHWLTIAFLTFAILYWGIPPWSAEGRLKSRVDSFPPYSEALIRIDRRMWEVLPLKVGGEFSGAAYCFEDQCGAESWKHWVTNDGGSVVLTVRLEAKALVEYPFQGQWSGWMPSNPYFQVTQVRFTYERFAAQKGGEDRKVAVRIHGNATTREDFNLLTSELGTDVPSAYLSELAKSLEQHVNKNGPLRPVDHPVASPTQLGSR